MSELRCPNDNTLLMPFGPNNLQCPICPFNMSPNHKLMEQMAVWVSVDERGHEGFMAVSMGSGAKMVLAHSDPEYAKTLRHMAARVVKTMPGWKARLIVFSTRETLEEI